MPRIEIIPRDWELSKEKARGDGAPTIDVCSNCKDIFVEGEEFDPDNFDDDEFIKKCAYTTVGSVECEHPDFDGEGYHCEACGAELGEEDN
jgi:hypothetical protein